MRVSQVHKEKALHCKEDAVLDHNSYPERFPTKSNKHPREVWTIDSFYEGQPRTAAKIIIIIFELNSLMYVYSQTRMPRNP